MTQYAVALHEDVNGVKTSAEWDGSQWKLPMTSDLDAGVGDPTDAAVLNPASTASMVALLKGLLTQLSIGATALTKAEDAAHVTADAGIMALAVRRDTAGAGSGTTGDYEALQTDSIGRLRTTVGRTLLNGTTSALAASLVVKASAGVLFRVSGYSTTSQFLQVYNSTTLPSNGVAPAVSIPIVAGAAFNFDFGVFGRQFTTGIVIGVSTTGPTKTAGSADTWIDAQYE